jgi:hypothetical protein
MYRLYHPLHRAGLLSLLCKTDNFGKVGLHLKWIRLRFHWPRGLWRRSTAARLRLWVQIPPGAWVFVCCVCCQEEVSATGWSLVQRNPTDCGASLCVITKPRGRGGHRPRWAAEPEMMMIIILIIICIFLYVMCNENVLIIMKKKKQKECNSDRLIECRYFKRIFKTRISNAMHVFFRQLAAIIIYYFLWFCSPARAVASSSTRFLDHTQRRATVGRTLIDEWSTRGRNLYLTHTTHKKQTSMPSLVFFFY